MSLPTFLRRVVEILSDAEVSYMLTGSLAAAFYVPVTVSTWITSKAGSGNSAWRPSGSPLEIVREATGPDLVPVARSSRVALFSPPCSVPTT